MEQQARQKNKRLSQNDRAVLKRLADRQVEATQDRSELDATYDAAATVIHAEVVKRWPQNDMKVLAKYDAARPDPCVYIAGLAYEQFCFRDDDKRIALRPTIGNCRRLPIQLSDEAQSIYDAFVAADKARKAAIKSRTADFKALIDNTANFNALAEIWPAAESLRSEIVGHSASLSVLSNEVVDRLKADPALELAA